MAVSDTVMISFDRANNDDKALLVVGRKPAFKPMEIVNAFSGQEAIDLYSKLITKKESSNDVS